MEVETVGSPPRSPRTPFTHLFTPHAALAWFCFQWLALMNSAYWASLGLLFSEQYVCEYEAQLLCVQFRYISEFPVGSSWGYPPWDFIWNTSLRGLPPCSPFLAPFLICLGSSFLINHLLINPLQPGSPRVPRGQWGAPTLTTAGRPGCWGSRSSGPPWRWPEGCCRPCRGNSGSAGGPRAPESGARGGARPRTAEGEAARLADASAGRWPR